MRRRILLLLAVVLLLLSFGLAMVWETPVILPFQEIALNFGSSVWHIGLDDWITVYRTPARPTPARFIQYGTAAPADALTFPLWVVSLALAMWPVYWLNKLRRARPLDTPIAGREPGSRRRMLGALALSHLLASYAVYLIWESFVPMFVRGTLMSGWAMAGKRLVEAPLVLLTRFPHAARYTLQFPGTSPRPWLEISVYVLTYMVVMTTVFWVVYVRPQRRRHAIRRGLCVSCGYDLRATPERCPECGHATQTA